MTSYRRSSTRQRVRREVARPHPRAAEPPPPPDEIATLRMQVQTLQQQVEQMQQRVQQLEQLLTQKASDDK